MTAFSISMKFFWIRWGKGVLIKTLSSDVMRKEKNEVVYESKAFYLYCYYMIMMSEIICILLKVF